MKQMLSELPYAHINDSSREAAAALISFEQKVSEAHKNVNSVLDEMLQIQPRKVLKVPQLKRTVVE